MSFPKEDIVIIGTVQHDVEEENKIYVLFVVHILRWEKFLCVV